MVHDISLVFFTFLCCLHDAGFHLFGIAVGELFSLQKFPVAGNEENPAVVFSNVLKGIDRSFELRGESRLI
jgi:hypothetical protein